MATGIIQQTNVTNTTLTAIYSGVPAGKTATINILICNAASNAATITLGLATGATGSLSASQYIERRAILAPFEVLERGGIVLQAGAYVYLQADSNPSGSIINLGTTITGYEV
jgi:hypothetical protein